MSEAVSLQSMPQWSHNGSLYCQINIVSHGIQHRQVNIEGQGEFAIRLPFWRRNHQNER
ncbi:hypothetical protein [Brenneria salicis]|uniref:hypothetical protein n=1 Tax=Brenneria salicis TaxID=55214 RepID=UPI00145AE814|nr:hypothetical protein [Brenneria salicis]